jgi:hypothetical protein
MALYCSALMMASLKLAGTGCAGKYDMDLLRIYSNELKIIRRL